MIELKDKISIKEQNTLLNKCVMQGLNLSDELQKLGLTYEHLRYRDYRTTGNSSQNGEYKNIEDLKKTSKSLPAISFFSGAGGLDIGFEYAGFTNLASIEISELFCDTLRKNFPNQLIVGPPEYSGNVKERDVIADILRKKLNLNSHFEGVFHGGPPCQPFSIAANQRFSKEDENFKRKGFSDTEKGNLLDDYIWFIMEFKPRVFIFENVPGLYEIDNGKGLNEALKKLSKIGYNIAKPQIVNAADYGIPQKRLRLIVIGTRENDTFIFPQVEIFQTPCLKVFDKSIENIENHLTREHTAQSILRYMQLDYGRRDHLGRVDRLNPYLPSKTVIAGGTKGGGRSHLHPYSPRTLSVRECARLQTFPDNYIFTGSSARQFTQVGNAVPPLLGFKIASQIQSQYFN